ncbi:MAG: DNA repair protein RecN [Coraliomargaritaceae bacterium]|jgi:DNA repair protein RecN (Recombination protein N)|tara:strand:+ start:6054 stop:7712 length:1659 start_codon:yes stop_codon:yes gene_type:complete
MLQYLKIENLALLKSLTLEFDQGFSVVTGETGAGKSVLLGAFNLLSGARSNKEMIRQGSDRLSVEASLFFPESDGIDAVLEELDLPVCDEGCLILFRSLDASKMSKIRINGSLATLSQLKTLGEYWIDFHGPGEPQKLFKEQCQLELLDAFSQNDTLLENYGSIFKEWRSECKAIENLKSSEQLDDDALRFLSNEINKMEHLDLSETAISELESNFTKISQSQELQSMLQTCEDIVSGESGLMDRLNALNHQMSNLSSIDSSMEELSERAKSLQIEADDLSQEIHSLSGGFDFDPEMIESTISQMNTWQELKRKYGGSLESLLEEKASLENKIAMQSDIEGSIQKLELKCTKLEEQLAKDSERLYKNRCKGAKALAKQATELLLQLGFKKAQLDIVLTESDHFTDSGKHTCSFLFSPNVGQDLLPLNKIASSGETARVMLALKTILADVDKTPVLVFDEVDANVGGEVGRTVGNEMARIADSHQVFCVTHLPQVASLGAQHFIVEKLQDDSETQVSITPIHDEQEQRLGEIARMLGDRNSQSALDHAKELLS